MPSLPPSPSSSATSFPAPPSFFPLLLLLLLLPLYRPAPLRHSISSPHLPPDFPYCTGSISRDNSPPLSLLIPPTVNPEALSLGELAAWTNEQAGELFLETAYDARSFSAFLQDRASVAAFKRVSLRSHLRRLGRPVKILVTAAVCTSLQEDFHADPPGQWFTASVGVFDASHRPDWEFYFSALAPSHVFVTHAVLGQLVNEEGGLERWLERVAAIAEGYLLSGSLVVLEAVPGGSDQVLTVPIDVIASSVPASFRPADSPSLLALLSADPLLVSYPPSHLLAYSLPPPLLPSPSSLSSLSPSPSLTSPLLVTAAYVLNLSRRPDRLSSLIAHLSSHSIPSSALTVLPSTDGTLLDLANDSTSFKLLDLTSWTYGAAASNPYGDHGYRPGAVGCILSHHRAWKEIARRGVEVQESLGLTVGEMNGGERGPVFMVLEDDVRMEEGFEERWREVVEGIKGNAEWDVLYLGALDDRDVYGDQPVPGAPGVVKLAAAPRWSGGGLFAYVLRPRAASLLASLAADRGIQQPVDWFLLDLVGRGDIVAYQCRQGLAEAPEGEGRDSDNDQEDEKARLVMLQTAREGDRSADEIVEEISFLTPEMGRCYEKGGTVEVTLNMVVNEDAPVFVERSRGEKICLSLTREEGERSRVAVETARRRGEVEIGGEEERRLTCIGWEEGKVLLGGMEEGRYLLEGEMRPMSEGRGEGRKTAGRRVWSSEFTVGECPASEEEGSCVNLASGGTERRFCRGENLYDFAKAACCGTADKECVDRVATEAAGALRKQESI